MSLALVMTYLLTLFFRLVVVTIDGQRTCQLQIFDSPGQVSLTFWHFVCILDYRLRWTSLLRSNKLANLQFEACIVLTRGGCLALSTPYPTNRTNTQANNGIVKREQFVCVKHWLLFDPASSQLEFHFAESTPFYVNQLPNCNCARHFNVVAAKKLWFCHKAWESLGSWI